MLIKPLPLDVKIPSASFGALFEKLRPLVGIIIEKLPPWPATTSIAAVIYLLLCRTLRYRRMNNLLKKYRYRTRELMAGMTNQHAFEIQRDLFELEFPFMATTSLQFALFKTYGIPTISSLLVATRQLAAKENAGRRAADTEVIIGEFIGFPPSSERANAAIARMNWQHSAYQKAGKISNGDMLYTLALFALEPRKWIKRYEWRELNEMEQCAIGVFWKSIGDAMHISYAELASYEVGWKDGLHWLADVEQWAEAYEQKYMVPDAKNHETAIETTSLILTQTPEFLRAPGQNLVISLLEERLRRAVMYPTAPRYYYPIKTAILRIRKYYLRYFSLPRFKPFTFLSEEIDKRTGRHQRHEYNAEPWYVPDTFVYRWGPQGFLRWLRGLPYPGPQWKSEGYVVEELGPKSLEGKGLGELQAEKERLLRAGRSGCPFAVRR